MTPLHKAVRLIYACGPAALIVAAVRAWLGTAPDWFGEGVYMACAVTSVSLLVFWGVSELMLRFFEQVEIRVVVVIVALAAVLTPTLYVVGAAFLGQGKAAFDTWHLLPLFAIMHQLEAVVVFGGLGAGLVALIAVLRLGWRKLPQIAAKDRIQD